MVADVISCDKLLRHPRGLVWELISSPDMYPMFFTGVGSCETLIESTEAGPDPEYVVLSAKVKARVRLILSNTKESLAIEGVDNDGLISVRLFEERSAQTRVRITVLRAASVLPAGIKKPSAAVNQWLMDGLDRIDDYLSGAPTSTVSNSGDNGNLQVSIAKLMVSVGVVRIPRPDRGLRQLSSLARWGFTLQGGYAAAAARAPKQLAIADDAGQLTFEQLDRRTEGLATGLMRAGITETSKIGLLARNNIAMVECLIAFGMLGVDVMLLNNALAATQIQIAVARNGLTKVFVDDDLDELVRYVPWEVELVSTGRRSAINGRRGLDDFVVADKPGVLPPTRPGHQVVQTSGTSGTPKGALRPTPRGFAVIAAMLSRMPMKMNETMLISAPIFHAWGLGCLQISTPLRATVILQEKFDPEECLRAIATRKVTTMIAVPVMLQRIVDLPAKVRQKYDTSSLRLVACSGSPLNASLVQRFTEAFGEVLYNFYGSTEVSWATIADPEDLAIAPTTVGRPPLGTTIAILDADRRPVPRGVTGRIFVGNEMLFEGYVADPSPASVNGLLDTGDLGHLDADGRLYIDGRDDEMIISGGENVFPRPVEDALAFLPQVSDVAVVGTSDDSFGQRLSAFVVLNKDAGLDGDMVRAFIKNRLSKFHVPRDVYFVEALPRTSTGKVIKRLLLADCERDGVRPQ